MNKLIYILVFLILGACDDFLEEEPKDQISIGQYFNSPEDARSIVNGIYRSGAATFYNGSFAGSEVMMGGYMSGLFDNERKGERAGPQEAQNLSLNPVNLDQYLGNWWASAYEAISRANTAIKYSPTVEDLSETETNRLLAEAKFFRAFNYFFLVKNFGDVPLITTPYENLDNIFVERDDIETVYNQIVTDLNWAIDQGGLANVPFPMNDFRITEGAAATLLADVHLQMAGYPLQANGSYTQAADAARIVINSGEYELIQHGPTLEESAFNVMRTSDVESEYIYSIEYDAEYSPNSNPVYSYPGSSKPPGIKYGNVWNGYRPLSEFIRVYEPDVDLRIQNQQLFFNEIEVNGTLFEFDEWVSYLWHDDRALFETGRGDKDIKVYRYAEVLLIASEAIARSEGVTSEAIGYLADVRSRAYWQTDRSDIISDLTGLSEQEFVEEVWKERLRELALDFKVWSDIQRTRKYPLTSASNSGEVDFVDVVGQSNNWGQTYQEHHLLYPIPNNELQGNPELEQNPGY